MIMSAKICHVFLCVPISLRGVGLTAFKGVFISVADLPNYLT